MSEAIISRRGGKGNGSSGGDSGPGNLQSVVISTNNQWTVPNHKGNISVRIFGGGGGGYNRVSIAGFGCGGGSGWMNNGEFAIGNGSLIQITIGKGGTYINSGGTTSFGTYLSANGGSPGYRGGSGGAGGGCVFGSSMPSFGRVWGNHFCTGFQFGGGGMNMDQYPIPKSNGSTLDDMMDGGTWGGGGGVSILEYRQLLKNADYGAGRGGMYGGGGGIYMPTCKNNVGGVRAGGDSKQYGGMGGVFCQDNSVFVWPAKNGINTIGNNSVPTDCQGAGLGFMPPNADRWGSWGGGGGFGGNGGSGGGGGYGGNGGGVSETLAINRATGGGGYGKGADGGISAGGGGGYYARGGDDGGGGGGYGIGGDRNNSPGFGGGGGSHLEQDGGPGVCIIQYYT